jgi:hypothetical protein
MIRKQVITGLLVGTLLSATFIPSLVSASAPVVPVAAKTVVPTSKPLLATPKPLLKRLPPPIKVIRWLGPRPVKHYR